MADRIPSARPRTRRQDVTLSAAASNDATQAQDVETVAGSDESTDGKDGKDDSDLGLSGDYLKCVHLSMQSISCSHFEGDTLLSRLIAKPHCVSVAACQDSYRLMLRPHAGSPQPATPTFAVHAAGHPDGPGGLDPVYLGREGHKLL